MRSIWIHCCSTNSPHAYRFSECNFEFLNIEELSDNSSLSRCRYGLRFSYDSVWFAGIFVKGPIPISFLVRVIMKVVRNTVEGVKSTYFMMVTLVRAAEWH
jgi:hypothetical protein